MGAKSLEVGPATLAVVALTNRAIEGAGLTRAHIEEAARISHNRLAVILRGERPPTFPRHHATSPTSLTHPGEKTSLSLVPPSV